MLWLVLAHIQGGFGVMARSQYAVKHSIPQNDIIPALHGEPVNTLPSYWVPGKEAVSKFF